MDSLVQILPPLSQSRVETAGCPRFYVASEIEGQGGGDSTPSERGQDVHKVMAEYVAECAVQRVPANWPLFDKLAAASGPVAGPILDGLRDSYVVDWKRVYGTEIPMALDEQLRPAWKVADRRYTEQLSRVMGATYSDEMAAHIGTLDVLLVNEAGDYAVVEDFKTHPQPFEADTYQANLYAFMVFKHLPSVQRVTFRLIFVRYHNCFRQATYRREDMPAMQSVITRARARQRITHERPDEALALPGKHCVYCPKAKNLSCPVADWNEYTVLSNSDRLRAIVFYRQMTRLHMPVLKAEADVNGPVSYRDGNGRKFEYGVQPVPSTRYPLDQTTIQVLTEYAEASGENLLDGRLNISSSKLKSLLDTKKRAGLKEVFEESIIETGTKPAFAIRMPEGVEPIYEREEE